VVVLLLLLMISGLLASATGASACVSGKRTDEELLQIAIHDLVSELRTAAAITFSDRLQSQSEMPSLGYLEELARGPSLELRRWIVGVLQRAYTQALEAGQLTLDELAAGISQGETFELRYARAAAVIDYLLQGEFSPEFASKFERLLGGSVEEFAGFSLDGRLRAVRLAAYSRLWIYAYWDEWFALHSCAEWEEIAAAGVTEELRSLAATVCVNDFSCILPDPEPRLKELAINGASHELRLAAARTYVDFHQFTNVMEMIALAVHGESEELRSAVRFRLARALVGGQLSDGEIYELARSGETPQLREAAGWALGMRWADETFREMLAISDIPRQSQARAYSLEQALIIFAAENTVIHPELALAAIGPLVNIWNS
jgi:hypothetical protein